jgi:uncharacterized protein (DUF1501 family)
MQRRQFLQLLGLSPWIAAGSDVAFAAAPATAKAHADYCRLLVLVELKGGNDGLNTVIPYADPEYSALRPRLAIARDQVVQLDEQSGLHPSLKGLLPLWQGQELAIVQGVGYPQPNLSHFRSIEIWETASNSEQYLGEGWLARQFAAHPPPRQFAADGVVVGSQELGPLAGGGARTIALANTEQFLNRAKLADAGATVTANKALAHVLKVEGDIRQAARGLKSDQVFRTDFPKHGFGNAVKTAAQVIAANAGVAVVRLTHNGFDTHSNQLNVHARLLTELAEGLTALRAALTELKRWDSTLVLTYAEFGRRPRENASGGTDHGTANVHFVLGGRVRGGFYGERPQLTRLENDNLQYAVDFRSLYATVIEKWWGANPAAVLGGRYASLPLLKT